MYRKESALNKKIITPILFVCLLLSFCISVSAFADESHITVGTTTAMQGYFFTDMWGSSTSDNDVKDLLHGYDLITLDQKTGKYTHNTSAVSGMSSFVREDGNITYFIMLHNDLVYSDGTKITAKDYAFSFLFRASRLVKELGGIPEQMPYILGYDDYASGRTPYFSGVRIMSENALAITLKKEFFPFFYEKYLLSCRPYPIHIIAPGAEVADDGSGAYISDAGISALRNAFSVDNLRKTVLDPKTGYLFHPSVVSGPYTLVSFNGTTAEFELNPYNRERSSENGAEIQRITYTLVKNDDIPDMLSAGKLDLVNKVTRVDIIDEIMNLNASGKINVSGYPRSGMSFISFSCENPAVNSYAVRQAIAWSMNRNAIAEEYTGKYGYRVDSFYGTGQWMYRMINGTGYIPDIPEIKTMSLDNLTKYNVSEIMANSLLDLDGWVINSDGIRAKVIDGKKVVLDLEMIYPEGNTIYKSFEKHLVPYLNAVGIKLRLRGVPANELFSIWTNKNSVRPDMIYLAADLGTLDYPSSLFTTDERDNHYFFNTECDDRELYNLAAIMEHTAPEDIAAYLKNWVAFQERFNKILPMIPIYGNIYADAYSNKIVSYSISNNASWAKAIIHASLQK